MKKQLVKVLENEQVIWTHREDSFYRLLCVFNRLPDIEWTQKLFDLKTIVTFSNASRACEIKKKLF